jgi:hypothetical protein
VHPSQGLECFDPALFKVYQTLVQALANVNDPEIRPFFDLDFAKRPPEELFHLPSDPDQIRNVASDPKFSQNPSKLKTRVRNSREKPTIHALKILSKIASTIIATTVAVQKIPNELRSSTKKICLRRQKTPDSPDDWKEPWSSPGQIRLADSSKATHPCLSSAKLTGYRSTLPSKRVKQSSTSKSLRAPRKKRDFPHPSPIGEPTERIR